MLAIFAAVAEMEREVIQERVSAGVQAACERGTTLGRPSALNRDQVDLARSLRASGKSYSQIARALAVGKSTIARTLAQTGIEE